VRQVEHSLWEIGPEARKKIPEGEFFPIGGRIGKALDDHGIRSGAHLPNYPVSRCLRRRGPGNARSKIDLGFGVFVRRRPVESSRRFGGLRCPGAAALLGIAATCNDERYKDSNPHRSHLNSPA
jgi:hypothetical protein